MWTAQPSTRPDDVRSALPWAVRTPQPSKIGRLGCWSWGQMVGRDCRLPSATRQGEGERCASCSSSPDKTGLADAVEFLVGVQQCSSFRVVAPWQACCCGCGWWHSCVLWCGGRYPPCVSERVCLRRVRACLACDGLRDCFSFFIGKKKEKKKKRKKKRKISTKSITLSARQNVRSSDILQMTVLLNSSVSRTWQDTEIRISISWQSRTDTPMSKTANWRSYRQLRVSITSKTTSGQRGKIRYRRPFKKRWIYWTSNRIHFDVGAWSVIRKSEILRINDSSLQNGKVNQMLFSKYVQSYIKYFLISDGTEISELIFFFQSRIRTFRNRGTSLSNHSCHVLVSRGWRSGRFSRVRGKTDCA